MVDMVSKEDGSCYIITVENPTPYEQTLVDAVKRVVEYNRQNGSAPAQPLPSQQKEPKDNSESNSLAVLRAKEYIKLTEFNRKAAEGVKEQLLLDLQNGKDYGTLLIYCAEIITRLCNQGEDLVGQVAGIIESRNNGGNK